MVTTLTIYNAKTSHFWLHSSICCLGRGLDKVDTLGNVLLQVGQTSVEELLLFGRNGTDGVNLFNTSGSELDVAGKVLDTLVLVQGALDKRGANDTLFTVQTPNDRVGKESTGIGHGEGGGTGTSLGLDDLVTTELNPVDESLVSLTLDTLGDAGLGEKGNDGNTRVTSDDGDVGVLGLRSLDLGQKGGRPDNVEGGDTKQPLGVKDTLLLQDLGEDGDGRVDGVGDDQDTSVGGVLGGGLGEVTDNGSVGVEEVITGHTRLPGDTSGDDDNLGTLEGRGKAV